MTCTSTYLHTLDIDMEGGSTAIIRLCILSFLFSPFYSFFFPPWPSPRFGAFVCM